METAEAIKEYLGDADVIHVYPLLMLRKFDLKCQVVVQELGWSALQIMDWLQDKNRKDGITKQTADKKQARQDLNVDGSGSRHTGAKAQQNRRARYQKQTAGKEVDPH